jgi:acetylornithine deacetylase/succinyl-diaminopimelate desuccinylase-like protein
VDRTVHIPSNCYKLELMRFFAAGFSEEFGAVIATPGVAEKGYFNVRLEVSSPGGHSSIPPAHTVRSQHQ